MQFHYNHLFSSLLIGGLMAIGGLAQHAHAGNSNGGDRPNGNRHSITGSPEQLSQRARELGEHICATIESAAVCPVAPISDQAANELSAMQAAYFQGQRQLHATLTPASFDRAEYERVQTVQARAIQAAVVRYMQFLGDTAAVLTPAQRQIFSPNGRRGH